MALEAIKNFPVAVLNFTVGTISNAWDKITSLGQTLIGFVPFTSESLFGRVNQPVLTEQQREQLKRLRSELNGVESEYPVCKLTMQEAALILSGPDNEQNFSEEFANNEPFKAAILKAHRLENPDFDGEVTWEIVIGVYGLFSDNSYEINYSFKSYLENLIQQLTGSPHSSESMIRRIWKGIFYPVNQSLKDQKIQEIQDHMERHPICRIEEADVHVIIQSPTDQEGYQTLEPGDQEQMASVYSRVFEGVFDSENPECFSNLLGLKLSLSNDNYWLKARGFYLSLADEIEAMES